MYFLKKAWRRLREQLERFWFAGSHVFCPCCQTFFSEFAWGGVEVKRKARCPKCGSLERHRAFARYLESHPHALPKEAAILHIAPETHVADLLRHQGGMYVPGDLTPSFGQIKLDLTRLPFQDGVFDVVVASHVLEHIPDDTRAMQEIARVLKPFGWACLTTPVKQDQENTDEDFTIIDPNERRKRFGQSDHVRWYGKDFYDRLKQAGLETHHEIVDDDRIGCACEEVTICTRLRE